MYGVKHGSSACGLLQNLFTIAKKPYEISHPELEGENSASLQQYGY